jgi:PAS domain S-box-containing protein
MESKKFGRILRVSLLIPVLVILAMAGVVGVEVQQLRTALGWVDHTDRVIAEVRLAFRSMVDEETGLRGYLLTRRDEFLEPYNEALPRVDVEFEKLPQLVADNPEQLQRIQQLRNSYDKWLAYSKAMLSPDAALTANTYEANLQGKQLMDDIRRQIDELVQEEYDLRDQRVRKSSDLDRLFFGSLVGLTVLLGTTLVLFTRRQLLGLSSSYEEALQDSRQKTSQVQEQREWFATTLRSIGDAVIATDAAGKVTLMNAVACELTEWTEQDARSHDLQEVFKIVNQETRQVVENPASKVRRLNKVVGLANHTVLISKSGKEYNIDDSGAPIRNSDGEMVGVVLVFRDITRTYQMERTLRTTEKLALAGRLSATIAHEIHNPLDTVGNVLYLIQSDSQGEIRQHIELAMQELQRVSQVTKSMLSLYRESKTPVPVSVKDALESVLALFETKIASKEASIGKSYQKGLTLEGFPAELRQVFSNFIGNALDAIGQHGAVSITASKTPARGETPAGVTVVIADNGTGISEENLSKLFLPFFTTKGEQGTGIGLWVSKGIIDKHGGTVTVDSSTEPDYHGTTFTVWLPEKFTGERNGQPPQIQPSEDDQKLETA